MDEEEESTVPHPHPLWAEGQTLNQEFPLGIAPKTREITNEIISLSKFLGVHKAIKLFKVVMYLTHK